MGCFRLCRRFIIEHIFEISFVVGTITACYPFRSLQIMYFIVHHLKQFEKSIMSSIMPSYGGAICPWYEDAIYRSLSSSDNWFPFPCQWWYMKRDFWDIRERMRTGNMKKRQTFIDSFPTTRIWQDAWLPHAILNPEHPTFRWENTQHMAQSCIAKECSPYGGKYLELLELDDAHNDMSEIMQKWKDSGCKNDDTILCRNKPADSDDFSVKKISKCWKGRFQRQMLEDIAEDIKPSTDISIIQKLVEFGIIDSEKILSLGYYKYPEKKTDIRTKYLRGKFNKDTEIFYNKKYCKIGECDDGKYRRELILSLDASKSGDFDILQKLAKKKEFDFDDDITQILYAGKKHTWWYTIVLKYFRDQLNDESEIKFLPEGKCAISKCIGGKLKEDLMKETKTLVLDDFETFFKAYYHGYLEKDVLEYAVNAGYAIDAQDLEQARRQYKRQHRVFGIPAKVPRIYPLHYRDIVQKYNAGEYDDKTDIILDGESCKIEKCKDPEFKRCNLLPLQIIAPKEEPLTVIENKMNRPVYVFGDVHGSWAKLQPMMRDLDLIGADGKWKKEGVIVVFVGDLIHKGADSRKVIENVFEWKQQANAFGSNIYVCLGNHEAKQLFHPSSLQSKYSHRDSSWYLSSEQVEFFESKKGRDYMKQMKLMYKIQVGQEWHIVTHAGIRIKDMDALQEAFDIETKYEETDINGWIEELSEKVTQYLEGQPENAPTEAVNDPKYRAVEQTVWQYTSARRSTFARVKELYRVGHSETKHYWKTKCDEIKDSLNDQHLKSDYLFIGHYAVTDFNKNSPYLCVEDEHPKGIGYNLINTDYYMWHTETKTKQYWLLEKQENGQKPQHIVVG